MNRRLVVAAVGSSAAAGMLTVVAARTGLRQALTVRRDLHRLARQIGRVIEPDETVHTLTAAVTGPGGTARYTAGARRDAVEVTYWGQVPDDTRELS